MARTKSKTRGTAQELSEHTESIPMAAGLVALGAGFLAATLLPPTQRERQAAERLQSGLAPIKEQARSATAQVKGRASRASRQVKETATEQAPPSPPRPRRAPAGGARRAPVRARSSAT